MAVRVAMASLRGAAVPTPPVPLPFALPPLLAMVAAIGVAMPPVAAVLAPTVPAVIPAVTPTVAAVIPAVVAPFRAPLAAAVAPVTPAVLLAAPLILAAVEFAVPVLPGGLRGNGCGHHQQHGGDRGDQRGYRQLSKHRTFLFILISRHRLHAPPRRFRRIVHEMLMSGST